jgi:hypothetical protein
MFFLLFLLDDRRIRIRISDKWIRIRIQEANNIWIRIQNNASNKPDLQLLFLRKFPTFLLKRFVQTKLKNLENLYIS